MGDPGVKGPVYGLGQRGGDQGSQVMGQGATTPKRDYGHLRDMGARVTRASKDKAHIKGGGGGTPLQADSTKEDRHITEGARQ